MFSYSDENIKKNISECDSYINLRLGDEITNIIGANDINNNEFVAGLNIDEVFELAIAFAWGDFYSRFNNDMAMLDAHTVFNRKTIGEMVAFSADKARNDMTLFLSNLLRVMKEVNFWEGSVGVFYSRDDVLTKLANEYTRSDYQFTWIRDTLQISMAKFVLESSGFQDALKLVSNLSSETEKLHEQLIRGSGEINGNVESAKVTIGKDFDVKKDELMTFLNNKEEEVKSVLSDINSNLSGINEISDRLSSYHSEFNFVGLYAGFKELKKVKDEELDSAKDSYHLAMVVAIILPLLSIGIHILFPQLVNGKTLVEWVSWAAPFAAVELLILYYARVIYSEVKSLRTQLVQINLRGALCQFIEEYMNYRKKIKNEKGELNDAALDKFDSLIFSAIQMDSDNIPGALDGINAIAELAGKVLAKGK
ncbi:Uncharacterised protein [Serratia quinivorans]|uniref:hypothetical protein n=1 Tax=Serratia quinivorans TaxID=137545 RepID=UPI0021795B8D|nr:hypothetical protein [Serratia quinivorans]CAI0904234.1 Uncharacterised protein [Serratia quinivorans]